VLDAGGRGTVVRIDVPGVTLRGLTLRGSGIELNTEDAGVFVGAPGALLEDLVIDDVLFGVNLKGAHGAVIRRVSIRGKDLPLSRRGDGVRLWYSDAVVMTELRLDRVRDILLWYTKGSTLHHLDVRRSRYGVHGMYADQVRVLESHFDDNAVGGYLMYSTGVEIAGNRFLRHRGSTGVGLAFKESDGVVVRGNLIAGNATGLYLDGTPRVAATGAVFTSNVIAGNDVGLHLLSSASGNVIAGNAWDHNAVQVRVDGGAQTGNSWVHAGRGNYWSDYAGVDLGGDGVGDQPYRATLWFEILSDRIPELRFLAGSLAASAVDFAARALPVFAPQVILEDPSPVTRMAVPVEFRHGGWSVSFALAALVLAALGAAALAAPARRPWRRA
jgi:nitrous oxidase accessory protein